MKALRHQIADPALIADAVRDLTASGWSADRIGRTIGITERHVKRLRRTARLALVEVSEDQAQLDALLDEDSN